MVNKPLIRPYFWGGGTLGGGWLNSHDIYIYTYKQTLPKTNITPENEWLEHEISYWGQQGLFPGDRLVSGRVYIWKAIKKPVASETLRGFLGCLRLTITSTSICEWPGWIENSFHKHSPNG